LEKRLQRSRTEKMIGGVCGGLAEYFTVDPTIVRVLWVLLTLLGGAGILLYVVLWIIMPLQVPAPRSRE
jgi:phage shock protein C